MSIDNNFVVGGVASVLGLIEELPDRISLRLLKKIAPLIQEEIDALSEEQRAEFAEMLSTDHDVEVHIEGLQGEVDERAENIYGLTREIQDLESKDPKVVSNADKIAIRQRLLKTERRALEKKRAELDRVIGWKGTKITDIDPDDYISDKEGE